MGGGTGLEVGRGDLRELRAPISPHGLAWGNENENDEKIKYRTHSDKSRSGVLSVPG